MQAQPTKFWREAWARGAEFLVWYSPAGNHYVYRRVGPPTTIDVYDGKSIVPQRRRAVPIDFYHAPANGRSFHYERTHMVVQRDGKPARRKTITGLDDAPWVHGSLASISGLDDPKRPSGWRYLGADIYVEGYGRQAVDADAFIDEFGTAISEMMEIDAREYATGAYGESAYGRRKARKNPVDANGKYYDLRIGDNGREWTIIFGDLDLVRGRKRGDKVQWYTARNGVRYASTKSVFSDGGVPSTQRKVDTLAAPIVLRMIELVEANAEHLRQLGIAQFMLLKRSVPRRVLRANPRRRRR